MNNRDWYKFWLGLGGNIGDVAKSMRSVIGYLRNSDDIRIEQVSSLYRTPPWGVEDQPEFLNSCIQISTRLVPESLLEICLEAEKLQNRVRDQRWGPRTIDVDLLMSEQGQYDSERLTIPHPRLLERAFVLVPLSQIAGTVMIDGKSIAQWRDSCDTTQIKLVGKFY